MRWLAVALALTLVASAQEPPPGLNIVIVEGDGAINNIRQRTAREPIVQVEDENHKPVAGAAVVFALPQNGASGTFLNGGRSLTVLTDNQGRAVARGLRPNHVTGKMDIHVTASSQGRSANTVISQTNVLAAAAAGAATGISAKLIAILAITGGVVAGATIAAVRLSNGGNHPVTTISPGTGTVGGPR